MLSHLQMFCSPRDCSPPGSSVHEISQAGMLVGLPFPSPVDLSHPGIETTSPTLQADSLPTEPPKKPLSRRYSKENVKKGHLHRRIKVRAIIIFNNYNIYVIAGTRLILFSSLSHLILEMFFYISSIYLIISFLIHLVNYYWASTISQVLCWALRI